MEDKQHPTIVVFGDNLTSVKFVRNGEMLDPIPILNGIASGALTIAHSRIVRK